MKRWGDSITTVFIAFVKHILEQSKALSLSVKSAFKPNRTTQIRDYIPSSPNRAAAAGRLPAGRGHMHISQQGVRFLWLKGCWWCVGDRGDPKGIAHQSGYTNWLRHARAWWPALGWGSYDQCQRKVHHHGSTAWAVLPNQC